MSRTIPIHDSGDRLYGAIDLAAGGTLVGIEILGIATLRPGLDTCSRAVSVG